MDSYKTIKRKKKLSQILVKIENTIIDFNVLEQKPNYSLEGFRAATAIFMSAVMDKMYDLQENESINMEDRIKMVEKAGNDLKNFVKVYTNIDTHKLY